MLRLGDLLKLDESTPGDGTPAFLRIPVLTIAVVLGACILTLGALGALHGYLWPANGTLRSFDLNRELVIPAFFSGALLLAAAGLCLAAFRHRLAIGPHRFAFALLGAFLAFMALDEILSLHESIEASTGVDWQTLYAPIVLVGGIGWLWSLRSLRQFRRAYTCLLSGAFAWLAAQVLEQLQYEGDVLVHPALVIFEEVLEMTGTTLFILAILIALRCHLQLRGSRTTSTDSVAG